MHNVTEYCYSKLDHKNTSSVVQQYKTTTQLLANMVQDTYKRMIEFGVQDILMNVDLAFYLNTETDEYGCLMSNLIAPVPSRKPMGTSRPVDTTISVVFNIGPNAARDFRYNPNTLTFNTTVSIAGTPVSVAIPPLLIVAMTSSEKDPDMGTIYIAGENSNQYQRLLQRIRFILGAMAREVAQREYRRSLPSGWDQTSMREMYNGSLLCPHRLMLEYEHYVKPRSTGNVIPFQRVH